MKKSIVIVVLVLSIFKINILLAVTSATLPMAMVNNCVFNFMTLVSASSKPIEVYSPKYSKHFKILHFSNFDVLAQGNRRYYIFDEKSNIPKQYKLPRFCSDSKNIFHQLIYRAPFKIMSLSATYLGFLNEFNLTSSLIAEQGVEYIYSPLVKKEMIKNISYNFSTENLISMGKGEANIYLLGYEQANIENNAKDLELLAKFNINHLSVLDYLEQHPLGRLEWLMYLATIFNQKSIAEKKFKDTEEKYLSYRQKLLEFINSNQLQNKKPKILIGEFQNGEFITPRLDSDLSQLIFDAGGEFYSFKSPQTKKAIIKGPISREIFLYNINKNPNIDIWITNNRWKSRKDFELSKNNETAYQNLKVPVILNNNLLENQNGANDYWENGLTHPDELLLDLMKIFYPTAMAKLNFLNSHQMRWYHAL